MEREKNKNSLTNPSLTNLDRIHEVSLENIEGWIVEGFIKPRGPTGA